MSRHSLTFSRVPFVRAAANLGETSTNSQHTKVSRSQNSEISGESAKSFYENVVGLKSPSSSIGQQSGNDGVDSQQPTPSGSSLHLEHTKRKAGTKCASDASRPVKRSSKRPLITKSVPSERSVNGFLKAAQCDDVTSLHKLLKEGIDVDATDTYGWTALMCAAQPGQSRAVNTLLEFGADKRKVNNQGQTALDIAEGNGRRKVSNILAGKETDKPAVLSQQGSFYCDICKSEFQKPSEDSHATSTLHLFNCKLPQKPTLYHIPENNAGFQMMLRSGWDADRGLGSEGKGNKFPVKTVLKRDRKGLGCGPEDKPKVTHFSSNDADAVKLPKSFNKERNLKLTTITKRDQKRRTEKERAKERNFRLEFYTE